jgi:hypothetical protein
MSWDRRGIERALLIAALLWALGFGAFSWFGAWRQSGELYVIDDVGARATPVETYEREKASRPYAGTTPQMTPEGIAYVVSNVALPHFKKDTKRHVRMVRFNHEEQGWFKFLRGAVVAAVPLALMAFYLFTGWIVRRIAGRKSRTA